MLHSVDRGAPQQQYADSSQPMLLKCWEGSVTPTWSVNSEHHGLHMFCFCCSAQVLTYLMTVNLGCNTCTASRANLPCTMHRLDFHTVTFTERLCITLQTHRRCSAPWSMPVQACRRSGTEAVMPCFKVSKSAASRLCSTVHCCCCFATSSRAGMPQLSQGPCR